mgnify:CR=1 FL=1
MSVGISVRRDNRLLSLTLVLIVALVSVLSAAHLSAHQTPDSSSFEDCLALHTTGLDSAFTESKPTHFQLPKPQQQYQLADYRPAVAPYFRLGPRAPPVVLLNSSQ